MTSRMIFDAPPRGYTNTLNVRLVRIEVENSGMVNASSFLESTPPC